MLRKSSDPVHKVVLCILMAFLVTTPGGCAKRPTAEASIFGDDETAYVVTILLDLSGSFSEMMAKKGKAYEFALAVIDRYFRDRVGSRDKIIIAQISRNKRALLWEGTPAQLRHEFPTPESFRDFLLAKADPSGSLVNEAIARALEYMMGDPQISSGKAKSALFVLSDMEDNGPDPTTSEQRVCQALANYAKLRCAAGFYYVDQDIIPVWQRRLTEAGFKDVRVKAGFAMPDLPNFE